MVQLIFFMEKASDAAPNTATSWTPTFNADSKPNRSNQTLSHLKQISPAKLNYTLGIRSQRRIHYFSICLFGQFREDILGVSHLGNPLGRHERTRLNILQSRLLQQPNQLQFLLESDRLLLVLEPIARSDFHDANTLGGMLVCVRVAAVMTALWELHQPSVGFSDCANNSSSHDLTNQSV
jgi:hypothetical protein